MMNKKNLLKEVFEIALKEIRVRKLKKKIFGEYDPGKYGIHIEEIEKDIYGLYEQTDDGPDGDTWEAWIIKLFRDEVRILSHKMSSMRMYHSEFFKRELAKIPYGEVNDV